MFGLEDLALPLNLYVMQMIVRHERNLSYLDKFRCYNDDGGRPSEFGLQELISNHRMLLHLRDVVVSDTEKAV